MIQKSLVALSVVALAITMFGMNARVALAAVPANDNVANATELTTLPFTDRINTAEATVEANESTDCSPITNTVWYKFDSGNSFHVLSVNSAESDYATRIAMYTGTPGSLQVRYCAESGGITVETSPSETWYMQVTGLPNGGTTGGGQPSSGNLVFSANATLIVPITVDLVVNPNASVNKSGTSVTVTGTLTCSRTSLGSVGVTVTQIFAGRLVAIASGGSDQFDCGPTPRSWTALLTTNGPVRFGPGNATFEASAQASDGNGDGAANDLGRIKLKRH